MRETLFVELGERRYPIHIGQNCLYLLGQALREHAPAARLLVVSDNRVHELYGEAVLSALSESGFLVESLVIPEGEKFKTIDSCLSIWNYMLANNFTRESVVIALGGGVVGDIAGFAAAAYMRGVPYVQVPTTLLAMVDSSVGGKTGVNHPLGKNMIGAFHQPRLVFVDLGCLATLSREEFRAGFAEVIKYGVIRDAEFFAFCETERQAIFDLNPKALRHVVKTSCAIKADVVAADELEGGLRAILNFGHTIGHAVESLTNYSLLKHGEAVAIGMVAAGRIAVRLGRFDEAEQRRLERLIEAAGLPVRIPARLDGEDLIERLRKDKKARRGEVRFVLPEAIGRVCIESNVPPTVLRDVLDGLRDTIRARPAEHPA